MVRRFLVPRAAVCAPDVGEHPGEGVPADPGRETARRLSFGRVCTVGINRTFRLQNLKAESKGAVFEGVLAFQPEVVECFVKGGKNKLPAKPSRPTPRD